MARTYNGRFDSPEEPKVSSGWLIGGFLLIPTWPSFFGLVASICCFVKYGKQVKEHRLFERFHRYCSVIGPRLRVSIKELKKVAPGGTGIAAVREDLQQMLYRGYFGEEAFIDLNRDELVLPEAHAENLADKARGVAQGWKDMLSDVLDALRVENLFQSDADADDLTYRVERPAQTASRPKSVHDAFSPLRERGQHLREDVRQKVKNPFAAKETAQTAPEAKPQPEPPKAKPKKRTYADELEATLNELYQLNEQIAHEGVSQRIDRIGTLTAGIFRVVIEKPEREQDVRKFMNYYLPTTLKLLRSYRMLEQQGYQSESIVESRKKIEGILDTLIQGYEKLLDRLFRDDALDIATDVDVLETMMAGDGLM